MKNPSRAAACALLLVLASPWVASTAGEGVPAAAVIGFDLGRLDDRGLQGSPGGLRSLDYEYCIPEAAPFRARVSAIDPSARFMPGSPGRIGCRPGQVLVLGNTHQPGFREVLQALAGLPFVERIQECVHE
ncbi:MAG: hypothetical protein ACM3ST_04670 [Bdellovibrio bacteriovorus]